MKLTSQLPIVLRLRMSGPVPLLPTICLYRNAGTTFTAHLCFSCLVLDCFYTFITSWNRAVVEKLMIPWPVKKSPTFYRSQSFIIIFTGAHRWFLSTHMTLFCRVLKTGCLCSVAFKDLKGHWASWNPRFWWWWLSSELFHCISRCVLPFQNNVHSVQQKSSCLKFLKSRTISYITFSCHHNLSHLWFPYICACMVFLCLPFTTAILAGCILTRDTNTFA